MLDRLGDLDWLIDLLEQIDTTLAREDVSQEDKIAIVTSTMKNVNIAVKRIRSRANSSPS